LNNQESTRQGKGAPAAPGGPGLLGSILLSLVVTLLLLVVAELGFRALLFSNFSFMQPLRDPGLYADQFDEVEFWQLQHLFSHEDLTPPAPHPELGWIGKRFDPEDNRHHLAGELNGRRPVLLFGDSYADCTTPVENPAEGCFDGILNSDPEFSGSALLLNYGAGGYGVGQIYLNMQRTLDLYDNPFVVVSFMLNDMDRTLLPFRIAQKPYFHVQDGQLQVNGYPIEKRTDDYLAKHPLTIRSYLYRLLLHGGSLPPRLTQKLQGTQEKIRKKIEVNRALLAAMIRELERRNLGYVFLVFYPRHLLEQGDNWRSRLAEQYLTRRKVAWLSSKRLLEAHRRSSRRPLGDYFAADNHPTRMQNELISAAIKQAYFDSIRK
jgi:hypothetical protein